MPYFSHKGPRSVFTPRQSYVYKGALQLIGVLSLLGLAALGCKSWSYNHL